MNNSLARSFTAKTLLQFAFPTVFMMVFTALYTMVDGIFVANYVGSNALSAVNMVYPAMSIIIAVAVMLATGGSAVVSFNMGEGRHRMALENFSMLTLVAGILGVLVAVFGTIFLEPILRLMRVTPLTHQHAREYLFPIIVSAPLAMFQMLFQAFFVTAGRPKLGMALTLAGGCANILLDWLFVAVFSWGTMGAAVATAIGYAIPGVAGLLYFLLYRKGTLYLVRPKFRGRVLLLSCGNGASEMVTNLAGALSTFLFNAIMLARCGEDGVAAMTVILYAQFLLNSAFMGFSGGVAPVFGYHYGAQNRKELHKLFRICMIFVVGLSACMFVLALVLQQPIISVFARPGTNVFSIAHSGFGLFAIGFLFAGTNIFASGFFTAFSDGKTSAIISLMRTFVCFLACIELMPRLFGLPGVFLAVPVAELLTLAISIWYFLRKRKVFGYAG